MEMMDLPMGLKLFKPGVFFDHRGFFLETFRDYYLDIKFVQENHSFSAAHVLRGLHFQKGQAKLIYVVKGVILDVAVDIRKDSPTYKESYEIELDAENHESFFIPDGFAHGFYVLSQEAHLIYKVSSYYDPKKEKGIIWNDPDLKIHWPVKEPVLSQKDQNHPFLKDL